MALFHLSVTQTKRSAGQSAIASAAYRAGERLYSEYYGEYSDYTRKGGVICSDILLPSHAVFLHRGISARYDCHRPWSRSGRMGRDQPAGRLRQRQPCDTFVSEKLTHKVEGHVAQNFGELIFRWVK